MADSTVSALPAAAALSGPELLYGVQSAADVKITATQIKTFATTGFATLGANTFTALQTITQASANAGIIASTGYSLTGASAVNMVDLAGTWNTSGNPVALKIAITNTASGATSKLLSLLAGAAGATSIFSVDQTGILVLGNASRTLTLDTVASSHTTITSSGAAVYFSPGIIMNWGGGNSFCSIDGVNTSINSANSFSWSSANDATINLDLKLSRRAAANLLQGGPDAAAPVAQTFSVQSVVAGTSNTAGANLTIAGSQGTGTGAGGDIIFQVAPAGTTGTSQNALVEKLRLTSSSTLLTPGGSAAFVSFGTAGNVGLYLAATGFGYAYGGTSGLQWNDGAAFGLNLRLDATLGWTSGAASAAVDTMFTRKAAASIQMGNVDVAAPVAQTLRVQSVVAGTSNTAGADWNITGSLSTGSGIAGKIIFNLSQIVAAATAQNAASPVITLSNIIGTGIRFNGYGAGAITSDASGNLTAASDERMKDVLGEFTDGLAELERIQPIRYRWRDDSGMESEHEYAGFAAGNVKDAIPMATGMTPDGYMTLQDRALLAACVNAIKQLATEIRR